MKKVSRFNARIGILAVTVLFLGFQNCSDPLPSDAAEYESTGGGLFRAGDAYSASKIPYVPQGRLAQDMVDYPTLTGFKAMAIAANGYGLGIANAGFASQAEANQIALESCQIIANNMPCAIFAEGDIIKYDQNDFYLNQVPALEFGARNFDVTKIPAYLSSLESDFSASYQDPGPDFKAVAISSYGVVMRGLGEDQAEANRRALEFCEALTSETCTLYATGDTVVFNVTVFNWNYTTKYLKFGPRAYAANQVPFVAAAARSSGALTRIGEFVTNGRKPVVAISRLGHFAVAADANETLAANRNNALAACNAKVSDPKVSCVVYSQNDQVVMTRETLDAGNLP